MNLGRVYPKNYSCNKADCKSSVQKTEIKEGGSNMPVYDVICRSCNFEIKIFVEGDNNKERQAKEIHRNKKPKCKNENLEITVSGN